MAVLKVRVVSSLKIRTLAAFRKNELKRKLK